MIRLILIVLGSLFFSLQANADARGCGIESVHLTCPYSSGGNFSVDAPGCSINCDTNETAKCTAAYCGYSEWYHSSCTCAAKPPPTAVVCIISSVCLATTAYYQLTTVFQLVDKISVDAKVPGVCKVDPKLTEAALAKLMAQANQLKADGVCASIVNNVQ